VEDAMRKSVAWSVLVAVILSVSVAAGALAAPPARLSLRVGKSNGSGGCYVTVSGHGLLAASEVKLRKTGTGDSSLGNVDSRGRFSWSGLAGANYYDKLLGTAADSSAYEIAISISC